MGMVVPVSVRLTAYMGQEGGSPAFCARICVDGPLGMGRTPTKPRIDASVGQTYRVPRAGKPARMVRIAGIRRGQQPKVSYYLVSRTGKRVESLRTPLYMAWMQWVDGAWRVPAGWEAVPLERWRP